MRLWTFVNIFRPFSRVGEIEVCLNASYVFSVGLSWNFGLLSKMDEYDEHMIIIFGFVPVG